MAKKNKKEEDNSSSSSLLDSVINAAKSLTGNDKVTELVDSLKKGGDAKGTLQQLYDVCKDSDELKDLGKTALNALTNLKGEDKSSSNEDSSGGDDGKGNGETNSDGKNDGKNDSKNDSKNNGENSSSNSNSSSSSSTPSTSEFTSIPKEKEPEQTVPEMFHDLDEVNVDTAFANEALNVMASVSFDQLIGNPLQAAIKAQRSLAKETLAFIKQDGMLDGKEQLAFVTMVFKQNGKDVKLRVPLITLVPYPSLLISEMKYHFTAKIDALSSVVVSAGKEIPVDLGLSSSGGSKGAGGAGAPSGAGGGSGATGSGASGSTNSSAASKSGTTPTEAAPQTSTVPKTSGNTSLSAKYGSGAMRGSRYNVETTMDVSITATQQEQPKGLSHIIDVLNQSVEVINTNGELLLSSEQVTLSGNYAVVSATYRNPKGDYDPYQVKCKGMPDDDNKTPKSPKMLLNGDDALLLFSEKGTYTVCAGNYTRIVFVN